MYFNVIIREDESYPMSEGRMFEYTKAEIRQKFERNGKPDLRALYELPTIMTEEFGPDTEPKIARIGYLDFASLQAQMRNPILQFPSSLLVQKGILGDETFTPVQLKWVGRHTRWSVLEGDPYRLLFNSSASQYAEIFQSISIDETLVAVMMPFKDHHSIDQVFQAIVHGAGMARKNARRVDQNVASVKITDDIEELIRKACAVVIDITGLNSNVVYELGYAMALKKKTILIVEGEVLGLPFDFRDMRVHSYQRTERGLEELSETIKRAILS